MEKIQVFLQYTPLKLLTVIGVDSSYNSAIITPFAVSIFTLVAIFCFLVFTSYNLNQFIFSDLIGAAR